MSADFTIKRDDRLPVLAFQLTYSSGDPIDISGATLKVLMRQVGETTNKIDTASNITITDGLLGKGEYAWAAGDTDTAGQYRLEVEATISGKKLTSPNRNYLTVAITEDLG